MMPNATLSLFTHVHALALVTFSRWFDPIDGEAPRSQRGQATAEYALVLLGAAAVALLVVAWAARSNRVGRLLDTVFEQLLRRAR